MNPYPDEWHDQEVEEPQSPSEILYLTVGNFLDWAADKPGFRLPGGYSITTLVREYVTEVIEHDRQAVAPRIDDQGRQ